VRRRIATKKILEISMNKPSNTATKNHLASPAQSTNQIRISTTNLAGKTNWPWATISEGINLQPNIFGGDQIIAPLTRMGTGRNIVNIRHYTPTQRNEARPQPCSISRLSRVSSRDIANSTEEAV
jgi:hypothetical protein